ncbi:glycosyltransferase [Psychrosphaera haliotis]|uniref:Glycosyltransferase n=2 Tax=Psychrosphaera haliotis TaxID=555083 RepID=A0A6N8FAB5_9GAMM|nr:glycosyltransferase [Psychrosphaera haliotis]
MFQEYRRRDIDAFFLARTGQTPHGGASFSTRNNSHREIMFHTTMDDGFLYSNIKTRQLWQEFREMLLAIKPTIVHVHHYVLMGVEILEEIKNTLPDCKLVFTIHEFLAICHRNGLMLKTDGKLCYKSSPRDCHSCFPDKQPGDFFLREKYFKSIFENVDDFVSPSHFLKQRYVDWGLNEEKIKVVENGQPVPVEITKIEANNKKVSFAFFGQVNPFKGIRVLLDAIKYLDKKTQNLISLDIHGANIENQSAKFKKYVSEAIKNSKVAINFHGSYEPHEMPTLLAEADWAIVPSIWWENSPMVIQEAFNYDVPLIVSDIGGMAEKVKHGVTGIHFRAGKPLALANAIEQVVSNPELRTNCIKNIEKPLSISKCADVHLELYKG